MPIVPFAIPDKRVLVVVEVEGAEVKRANKAQKQQCVCARHSLVQLLKRVEAECDTLASGETCSCMAVY